MPNFVILLEAPQAEAGCRPAAAVMPSQLFVSVSQFYPTASQGVAWARGWQSALDICMASPGRQKWATSRYGGLWDGYHGQVCRQQRMSVPLHSGLGLQPLDGILNSFYCQPPIIPTKASDLFNLEQLYSDAFTRRVSQSRGTGKEVTYNLFNFFFWLFSAVFYSK